MRYAVQMEKGNPYLAQVAQKTKDEMIEFVSYYRRFTVWIRLLPLKHPLTCLKYSERCRPTVILSALHLNQCPRRALHVLWRQVPCSGEASQASSAGVQGHREEYPQEEISN